MVYSNTTARCKICGAYLNGLGQDIGRDICEDCRLEICKHYNSNELGYLPSIFPVPSPEYDTPNGTGDPVVQPDYVGDPIPPNPGSICGSGGTNESSE